MTGKIPRIKATDAIRALEKAGFLLVRQVEAIRFIRIKRGKE